MKCTPRSPLISGRDANAIADALAVNRRGYTPEWTTSRNTGEAGCAVNDIFARYLEIQRNGLNAMPQRLQLEFLESLGAQALPPQPARAPLVFELIETASRDATVPLGTRVAAVLAPAAPSLESDQPAPRAPAPEFFTEQEFTAMRGTLSAVYSIDPEGDTYADHSSVTAGGFTIFDDMTPVPHRLYLGHSEFFRLTGSAQIVLSFDFATYGSRGATQAQPRPLLLDWEYLSTDGWQPLQLVEDGTERFTVDGKMTLAKVYGPDSKEDVVGGNKSCWIRATVSNRVPSARIARRAAGYLLRYTLTGAQPGVGDLVGAGSDTQRVTVLESGTGYVVSDAPLSSAVRGAPFTADNGTVIGTVVGAPPEYRLPVESSRDLLAGDGLTVDGSARATLVTMDGDALSLSAPLSDVAPGMIVTLADALPPLRPDGADAAGVLPRVDVIRARVGFGKTDLPADSAYLDDISLDISKDFYPFGEQPARFAAFYIACKDAFTRTGARIELNFYYIQPGLDARGAAINVEFFDGMRWIALDSRQNLLDGTASFTRPKVGDLGYPHARISFDVPAGWQESELNGEKQHWLRIRLAQGDYGEPISVNVVPDPADATKYIVQSTPSTLQPPIVARLAINYLYFTNPDALDFCVTENDFAFAEHSEDARWPRSPFAPFVPVSDRTPALHLGFSNRPPTALVSLLAQVLVAAEGGDPQPFAWDYWGARGWTELSVRDTTTGLKQTGLVQFVGAPDALPRAGLGGSLYRIRARLKSGLASQRQIVRCAGIWLNAVWARQGQRVDRDGLGTSNGNPDQTFALPIVRAAKAATTDAGAAPVVAFDSADFERALDTPLAGVPILADEKVEVREWSGRGDDWRTVLSDVDPSTIRFDRDPQDATIMTAAWVTWQPQPHFYRSGPKDRHYVVERARGVFRFPGVAGFIPPAGAPIVASYVTGGAVEGNVPVGAIQELRSGVGFVQSVTNPMPASAGASAELLRNARDRSSTLMRHRDRAVSYQDYESLALSASSEVARARAVPLDGPAGRGARGFVGMLIVPRSLDAMPMPTPELCSSVIAALARRAPAGIAGGIRSVLPSYVQVGVRAEILPLRAEDAGRVEARVRARLMAFLHPLTGGALGRGWEFGDSVYLSDVAALIEDTTGVDAVRFLQLIVGQAIHGDRVTTDSTQLVAAGDSQLKIVVPNVPYAIA